MGVGLLGPNTEVMGVFTGRVACVDEAAELLLLLLLLLTIVDPIGSMGDGCCEGLTGLVIVTGAREAEAAGAAGVDEEAAEAAEGVEERRAAERELLGIGAEAGLWKGMAECLEEGPEDPDAEPDVEEDAEED